MTLVLEVIKKSAAKVKRSDEMSELHSTLLGDIERALDSEGITKTELEAAGGPSQQVLNKWAHGSSPTLRTLEKLATALSSELIVAIPKVSDPRGYLVRIRTDNNGRGDGVHQETREVMEWMEEASDDLRAAIRRKVRQEILGRANHPQDADELPGPLARNK